MNRAAQITLALWTGLFLVLPNCYCQVLVGLGIETQSPAEQRDTRTMLSVAADPASCHCDDTSLKTAETAPTGTLRLAPPLHFVSLAQLGGDALCSPAAHYSAAPRAPPGATATAPSRWRERICCWQV